MGFFLTTVLSGLSGYAHKQASICTRMAERCALYWLPHLMEKGIMPEWGSKYESRLTVQAEDSEGEDLGNESDEDCNEDDQEVDINDGDNYIIDSR